MKPIENNTAGHSHRTDMRQRWAGTCVWLCAVALLPACSAWNWTKTQVSGSGWSTPEAKTAPSAPKPLTQATAAPTPVQPPAAPTVQPTAPTPAVSMLPPPEPVPDIAPTEADILVLQDHAPEVTPPPLPPAPQPIEPPPAPVTAAPLPSPAAHSAPIPPAQPLARGHYAVQVGVFFVHDNALTIRDRIASKLANEPSLSVSERVVRDIKKGKRTYVVVGSTTNAQEAEALAQRLHTILGQGVTVFRH